MLVWLVTTNTRTMQFSATVAILVAIVVSLFDKDDNRITPPRYSRLSKPAARTYHRRRRLLHGGIIAGCITATGLCLQAHQRRRVHQQSGLLREPQFIACSSTMICCIILGMGVPTTANYCIMASTCAPILITMGVPKICALLRVLLRHRRGHHPPVALAATPALR